MSELGVGLGFVRCWRKFEDHVAPLREMGIQVCLHSLLYFLPGAGGLVSQQTVAVPGMPGTDPTLVVSKNLV